MSVLPTASMTALEANELRLRNHSVPWAYGYELASACALQAVTELRRAFNDFAKNDPYGAGNVERWDLSADAVQREPVVQVMATTFSLILNRRGLLKIDPS